MIAATRAYYRFEKKFQFLAPEFFGICELLFKYIHRLSSKVCYHQLLNINLLYYDITTYNMELAFHSFICIDWYFVVFWRSEIFQFSYLLTWYLHVVNHPKKSLPHDWQEKINDKNGLLKYFHWIGEYNCLTE